MISGEAFSFVQWIYSNYIWFCSFFHWTNFFFFSYYCFDCFRKSETVDRFLCNLLYLKYFLQRPSHVFIEASRKSLYSIFSKTRYLVRQSNLYPCFQNSNRFSNLGKCFFFFLKTTCYSIKFRIYVDFRGTAHTSWISTVSGMASYRLLIDLHTKNCLSRCCTRV